MDNVFAEAMLFFVFAFGLILAFLLILGAFTLLGLKMLFGGRRRDRRQEAEEASIMQDLHRGFKSIEERVDALETIMLENAPQGKKPPDYEPAGTHEKAK